MSTEPFTTAGPLPDGCLMVGGIEIVSFIDADGDECYRVHISDNLTITSTLGLLRHAEHEAVAMWRGTEDDDDDLC